jgi:predicted enzyme related to lactoylglutathione lyase
MASSDSQPTQRDADAVDPLLARNGGLSYLEIPAIDGQRSATFYEKVLGWKVDRTDPNHLKFSDQSGHLLGRWRSGRVISREPGLLPYVYVDRIDEVVSRVAEYDGEIVKAPYQEGNLLIAPVRDPAGNLIGLWQAASG